VAKQQCATDIAPPLRTNVLRVGEGGAISACINT